MIIYFFIFYNKINKTAKNMLKFVDVIKKKAFYYILNHYYQSAI